MHARSQRQKRGQGRKSERLTFQHNCMIVQFRADEPQADEGSLLLETQVSVAQGEVG